eukprot:jgi/Astpho2/4079/fgenesh1_pm.00063_%23_32_t
MQVARAGEPLFQSNAPRIRGGRICYAAATGGHLEVLQWLLEQGWDWHGDFDEDISEAVARKGHLAVLRCLQHHGCAWDWRTCKAAATGGHLAVLQYAHQNGWGHLAVLQYARQNGCGWGPGVCLAAGRHGNLSILKWLRQHGCPWEWWTNSQAACSGQLEILKWARQQQSSCPWWPHGHGQVFETCKNIVILWWQMCINWCRSIGAHLPPKYKRDVKASRLQSMCL